MENEEIKKRIENAQKFKEFLKFYPPQTQARFIYAKSPDAYREIDPTLKEAADLYFKLRSDYFKNASALPQKEEPEKKEKEHKKEEVRFYYEEGHADEGLYETTEEQTRQNQVAPRSRLEQMQQAGKMTSRRIGTDNWGTPEPIGPPPADETQTSVRRPSTAGLGVLGRTKTAARSLRGLSASLLGRISPFGRGVSSLAKFGGKRFAVAGIGALPFIATALIIVLLLLIPVVIIGASAKDPIFAAKVGFDIFFGDHTNPNPTPTPTQEPGPGPNPTKCETNPTDCLREEFNIAVNGPSSREKLNDVYKLLSEVGVATKYKVLMKTSGPTILEFQDTSEGGCPGRVQPIGGGRSSLTLRNYSLTGCSQTTRKSRLTHETGHIIRNGHMRLFELFVGQAYYPKNSDCYYRENRWDPDLEPPYFIKTYDTDYAWDSKDQPRIQGDNETMAEFIALYVIPQGSYPRRCPVGYNWVKENIFRNYVF